MKRSYIKCLMETVLSLLNVVDHLLSKIISLGLEDQGLDLIDMIKGNNFDNAEEIMEALDRAGVKWGADEKTSIKAPKLTIANDFYLCLTKPVNGGELTTFVPIPDTENNQAGIEYSCRNKDGDSITLDLCVAEVHEYNPSSDNPDNKDIDVYTWSDLSSEDYSEKFSLKYDDIINLE